MKYLFFTLVCFFFLCISGKAQLTFIGIDEVQKKRMDGYVSNYQTVGGANRGGYAYFLTPNGYLYQTDGTEEGTKPLENFIPQNSMFLAATNNFVYYSTEAGSDLRFLQQFDPINLKRINSFKQGSSWDALKINGNKVPGYDYVVSQLFESQNKDKLFLRHFTNDKFTIYNINDGNASIVNVAFTGGFPTSADPNVVIGVNTQVIDRGADLFFNGRVKPKDAYETSITILSNGGQEFGKYNFKCQYQLKEKGVTLYDNFLRIDTAIYSVGTYEDKGKKSVGLFYFKDKNLKNMASFFCKTPFYKSISSQVIDNSIYLSTQDSIFKFQNGGTAFFDAYSWIAPDKEYNELQKYKPFLAVGNYLMARKANDFYLLNLINGKWETIKTPVLAKEENRFRTTENYAYAGKKQFYFTDMVNGQEQFTGYNPVSKTYTAIGFPEFKKEIFVKIKAIYQHDNGFVILTQYNNKKDKPVYRMFNYKEELATSAVNINTSIVTEKIKDNPVEIPVVVTTEKNPYKLSNKTSAKTFEENFKNNKNNWTVDKATSTDSLAVEIKDNSLVFNNKQNGLGFISISIPTKSNINLETDENWSFAVDFKFIAGTENNMHGIHFNDVENGTINNGLIFATDAKTGSFVIYNKRGKDFYTIKAWTKFEGFKTGFETNNLKVVKLLGQLIFFINDKMVYQTANKFVTKAIGFTAQAKQTVAFSNMKIKSFATEKDKTEKDKLETFFNICIATGDNFNSSFIKNSRGEPETWLPSIMEGGNFTKVLSGIPSGAKYLNLSYGNNYYDNSYSSNDTLTRNEKIIKLSKMIAQVLDNYTKRTINEDFETKTYWQSNNKDLPSNLVIVMRNFDIDKLYFTEIYIVQAPNLDFKK